MNVLLLLIYKRFMEINDLFEKAFNFKPTAYYDGILKLSKTMYKKQN